MDKSFPFIQTLILRVTAATVSVIAAGCSDPEASHLPVASNPPKVNLESQANEAYSYPDVTTNRYDYSDGNVHIYLVQEPDNEPIAPASTAIFIYLHGAGGKEEQGMDIFPSLRHILNEKGWVFVCPRDYEYTGLYNDLIKRYGKRPVYLSGASAGGSQAFWEAESNPDRYAGLVLMCPAMRPTRLLDARDDLLPMPTWIVCGSEDRVCAATSRGIEKLLRDLGRNVYYREIPGGGHGAPTSKIDWNAAIDFLIEHSQDTSRDKGRATP